MIAVVIVFTIIVCAVAGIVFNNSNRNEIEETTTTATETTAAKIEISKKDKENFNSI